MTIEWNLRTLGTLTWTFSLICVLCLLTLPAFAAKRSVAACPCGIWPDDVTPTDPVARENRSVTLGVRFKADSDGKITAIRFYKDPENTGAHVGSLWDVNGNLLGSVTFTETESGWQLATFAQPIPIAAHETYVASYFSPDYTYTATGGYFAAHGVDNGPLHAFGNMESAGNGVFAYGNQNSFPNASYHATNYWVDVVFEPTAPSPPGAAPILVITTASNPFTRYYGEILLAEGLNEFATADIANVTAATLASRDVVVLGEMSLTAAQVAMLSDWVNAGGNLIAMRPDKKLAGLLGLTDSSATLQDGYVRINPAGPGLGIVNQAMQFHSVADRYELQDAIGLATLYANESTATVNPAVTVRAVGNGQAAAFVYDLAKSVVFTRQGNPLWARQERDQAPPLAIRSSDLFFPDYVDFKKITIPQADEQQRLLANLITQMNFANKPLPRFWYLPNGLKAAVVHALDDHGTPASTRVTFDMLLGASRPGCIVADWQCLRGTSWGYFSIALTDAEARSYVDQGFEIGVHVTNGAADFAGPNFYDIDYVSETYGDQIALFRGMFPSAGRQRTHRYHAALWSDWVSQAKMAQAHGIRFSLDYYYWPQAWIRGRAGLFTGSGFPQRFADTDGTKIDVYQGVSNFVDEALLTMPDAMNQTLDKALGREGFYGMFGTHNGHDGDSRFLNAMIGAANSHNVPIITAEQALTWLDGRNSSSFSAFAWSNNTLEFTIAVGEGARNLRAMLPVNTPTRALSALTRDGVPVTYTREIIKGVDYAFFPAIAGSYAAAYAGAPAPPVLPLGGMTIWPAAATPANPAVIEPEPIELGVKFKADRDGQIVAIRFYKGAGDAGTHIAHLWDRNGTLLATGRFLNETASGWQQVLFAKPVAVTAGATYIASYHTDGGRYAASSSYFAGGGTDTPPLHALSDSEDGGNGVFVRGPSAFPTLSSQATNYWVDPVFVDVAPLTLWDNAIPAEIAADDSGAVELGVRFRSEVDGKIRGIRFHKGTGNDGPHIGTLWTADGAPLRTATFTNETATGWQEVRFEPINVTANTTYVASYHAPKGHYNFSRAYFVNGEQGNAPLHALQSDFPAAGNGVYRYGTTSGFPTNSSNGTNYWVDVLFEPNEP